MKWEKKSADAPAPTESAPAAEPEATEPRKPKKQKKKKREKKPRKETVFNVNADKYIKPTNDIMRRILRPVLWFMLVAIFARGVVAILQPNPLAAMQQTTAQFMQSQAAQQAQSLATSSFAQNFAFEYLTYTSGNKKDFIERVKPYLSTSVEAAVSEGAFKHSAAAIYVQATEVVAHNDTQFDVTVLAKVQYSTPEVDESGNIVQTTYQQTTSLVVPVEMTSTGMYVVADLPVFVAVPAAQSHTTRMIDGVQLDKTAQNKIRDVLNNFLKAYYEESQTRIDYYLSASANAAQFRGLHGRYDFLRIDSLTVYVGAAPNRYLATVKIYIQDTNKQELAQQFHIELEEKDNQYYLVSMGTKTTNIAP